MIVFLTFISLLFAVNVHVLLCNHLYARFFNFVDFPGCIVSKQQKRLFKTVAVAGSSSKEESCGVKLCIFFLIEASKKVFLYVLFNKYCVQPLKTSMFGSKQKDPAYFLLAVN